MTILIDNFTIGVNDWILVSNLAAFQVDAVDHTHGITTTGTYFLHDGVQVPTTFSGITGGYRMFYTPTSVVSSGVFTITAHVTNTISGVVEQDFDLLYGYNLLFDELVDWGPNFQVDVLVNASNEVICPNTVGEGFYFITADLPSVNLGATILPVEPIDLGASIYPQSTAFFYGSTYEITVSGIKDYSGNIMDPYTLIFTIEDPTS
jgi:hypothetical protein